MFSLTHQERKVLLAIAGVILLGGLLRLYHPPKFPHDSLSQVSMPAQRHASLSEPINVNTAGAAELARLPGIGPVIAQRIIAWRSQYGRLESLEDLQRIKGIGQKKIERLRSHTIF